MAYDANLVLDLLNAVEGYHFVGPDEIELLTSKVGQPVTVDVVMFPFKADAVEAAPSRWRFAGTLVSYLLNESGTKGRFVFLDGTVILFNKALLG